MHRHNIPSELHGEYLAQETMFIKKRVHLFCMLTVFIYFAANFLWFLIYPMESTGTEIFSGLLLLAGGGLILYLNSKFHALFWVKTNAYFFTALLLAILVKLGISYHDTALLSSSVFVFVMFFVSVIIPWEPLDVAVIGALHILAYSLNFFYIDSKTAGAENVVLGWREYLDGFIPIFLAVILCFVMRREETKRNTENFLLLKKVESSNKQMRSELVWATRVHKTIIPGNLLNDKVDVAVNYLPAYYIGGDYTRFTFLDDDRMLFILSDVTGHGIPAALLVNRFHAEFERISKKGVEPGELLKELNDFITDNFSGCEMYMSAFCGMLDFGKKKFMYSNYGHPPQYIYSAKDKAIRSLSPQATLLGLPMKYDKLYQEGFDVNDGDKILLFTDGVSEAANADGEQYGGQRIEEFLRWNEALSSDNFNKGLMTELNRFKKGRFQDDICIMTITLLPEKL